MADQFFVARENNGGPCTTQKEPLAQPGWHRRRGPYAGETEASDRTAKNCEAAGARYKGGCDYAPQDRARYLRFQKQSAVTAFDFQLSGWSESRPQRFLKH